MNGQSNHLNFDALIVGGGVAGGESALNLASTGYKVLLVEKESVYRR